MSSSLRATIAEARCCLERVNAPDANATVKRILGKKPKYLSKTLKSVCSAGRKRAGACLRHWDWKLCLVLLPTPSSRTATRLHQRR